MDIAQLSFSERMYYLRRYADEMIKSLNNPEDITYFEDYFKKAIGKLDTQMHEKMYWEGINGCIKTQMKKEGKYPMELQTVRQTELFKIEFNNDRLTVLARELHEFLGVGTEFRHWFPRMCEYGFTEDVDYTPVIFDHPQNGQPTKDYQLTIEMAKEICMIQRSEKGKQARQYFIRLEKDWNSPEKVMYRALDYAHKQLENFKLENSMLKQINNELKPKADYYDDILKNKGLVTTTVIAKDYGMSAQKFNELLHTLGVQFKQSGQWFLYSKYQDKGYTHSETVEIVRNDGRLDIKMSTKWTQKGRVFLYELLKKSGTLPVIERELMS